MTIEEKIKEVVSDLPLLAAQVRNSDYEFTTNVAKKIGITPEELKNWAKQH